MKSVLIGLGLLVASFAAYAACTSQTIFTPDGVIYCQTCCYSGNCTTNCF